jgi:hypothetical protein
VDGLLRDDHSVKRANARFNYELRITSQDSGSVMQGSGSAERKSQGAKREARIARRWAMPGAFFHGRKPLPVMEDTG